MSIGHHLGIVEAKNDALGGEFEFGSRNSKIQSSSVDHINKILKITRCQIYHFNELEAMAYFKFFSTRLQIDFLDIKDSAALFWKPKLTYPHK